MPSAFLRQGATVARPPACSCLGAQAKTLFRLPQPSGAKMTPPQIGEAQRWRESGSRRTNGTSPSAHDPHRHDRSPARYAISSTLPDARPSRVQPSGVACLVPVETPVLDDLRAMRRLLTSAMSRIVG